MNPVSVSEVTSPSSPSTSTSWPEPSAGAPRSWLQRLTARSGLLGVIGAAVILLILGMWAGDDAYNLSVLTASLVYGIAALGLYYAYSVGGMFAFGQAAMMGLGAYITAKVCESIGFVGGVLLAMVVTAGVGALLALVLRKAQHMYFAVGTLAFAELCVILFHHWDFLGGERSGNIYGIPAPGIGETELDMAGIYWLIAGITLAVVIVATLVNASPMRRSALAVKNNPTVAQANGIPVTATKVRILVFASVLGGLAGALHAHTMSSIAPESYGVGVAIDLFLMVLIGGPGTMWGALLGAFVLRWLPEFLRPIQQYETVAYSFLLLATIVLLPQGILGGVSRLFRKVVGRRVRG